MQIKLSNKEKSTKLVITNDKIARYTFFTSGIFVIAILLAIVFFLIYKSGPFFGEENIWDFLTGKNWIPDSEIKNQFGIIPLVVSTFLVTFGSMVFAIPIGLGVAIFLSEFAKGKLSESIKFFIEILSSVPSVVIGFIGLVLLAPQISSLTQPLFIGIPLLEGLTVISLIFIFFILILPTVITISTGKKWPLLLGLAFVFILLLFPFLKTDAVKSHGLNAINGSLLISLMALPTIISISTDSLRNVPKSLREASLGLGASKWETIVKTVLPAAKSGILASFMLGIGRAIGETMTVLMATGNSPATPGSIFDSLRTMTATIAIELGEVPFGSTHFHALFAVGFILFLISFAVNMIADKIINRSKI